MKYGHGEGALFTALLATFAACADPTSRTVGPSNPSSRDIAEPAAGQQTEERASLTKIARLVAMAIDNEPARQHLKRDMRAAPFREHKLELKSYLLSKDGRSLFDRMAAMGGGESAVLGALAAIRPLEFYMPVVKHRETWNGKAQVLVVSQLDEPSPIVAFNQSGREVTLDRKTPPDQPTLSIVPVETRFDQPMPSSTSRNARDLDGNAIGTLEPLEVKASSVVACDAACDDDGGSGSGSAGAGGSPPPIPPGLYLEFSRILDAKEPWFRGDPEIEVHVHGPTSTANPQYGDNLSCSGEHAADYRKVFDQNGGFWEGEVMVFSNEESVAYVNKFSEGFHVIFWEDDNEPCTLKYDTNTLMNVVQSAASAFGSVAVKLIPGAPWYVVRGLFVAQLFANSGAWLLTNDDFLGIAVDQRQVGNPYPANTHVIMDGTTLNGRANLVYR